jgi:hypothetical protein
VLLRVISIALVEGAANHADRVVVGFLRPLVHVRDLGELGVSDLFEYPWTDLRSPDLREEFAITRAVTKARSFFVTRESQAIRNSSKTWSHVRRFCAATTFLIKR